MKSKAKSKGSKMKKLTQPIFRTRTRAAIVMMSIALVGVWTLVFTQASTQDNVQFILFCSTDSCANQSDLNAPADYIPKWWQREITRPMNVAGAPNIVTGSKRAADYRAGGGSDKLINVLNNIEAELTSRYSPTTKVVVLLGFSSDSTGACGYGTVNGNFSVTDKLNSVYYTDSSGVQRLASCGPSYYVTLAHELGHNFDLGHTANKTLMDGSGVGSNLDVIKLDGGQANYIRTSGQAAWFDQTPSDPAPDGDIYTKNSPNCDYISGWASDGSDRNQKLAIHIYEGSTLVGDTQANQNLAGEAGLAAGHNFVWNIPANKKDGQSHTYRLHAINYPDPNNGRNVSIGEQTMSCAAPVSTPTGNGTGLTGVYFDNMDYTGYKFNRTDATVNFDFGSGSPDSRIAADTFSVRWLGEVQAQSTGTYTFYTTTDNGVRLYVNNQLVIDKYADGFGPTEHSGTISLTSGQKYSIKMEFYENGGGAMAKLAWSGPSVAKQTIPASQLYTFTGDVVPPGVPTSLRKNGTETSSSIPLAWTAPSGEVPAKYQLYRDNVLVNGNITATTYNDTGLAASRSYSYFVRALDAAGNVSDNSNSLSVSTTSGAGVTYNPIKGVVSGRCIDVANDDRNNGGKIQLYDCISAANNQKWALMSDKTIRSLSSGKCLEVKTDVLNPNGADGFDVHQFDCEATKTIQQWVVNTSNLSICSVASNKCLDAEGPSHANHTQIQIWEFHAADNQKWNFGSDTTKPTVPGSFRTSGASQNSVSLAWNASTDNVGVTKYVVFINGPGVITNYNVGNVTSYTVNGLQAGSSYTFQVVADDAAGNRSDPATINASTSPASDVTPPSKPSKPVIGSVTHNSVAISWPANPAADGVTKYRVYRNGTSVTDVTSTNFTDTGLSASTTYNYTITAWDAANNQSVASDATGATTAASPDTTPPTKPGKPVITSTTTSSISFNWPANPAADGVTKYRVYRNGTSVTDVTTTSFTDTGLPASTTYTYTITAWDAAGNQSAVSDATNGTTQTPADTAAPSAPASLRSTGQTATSQALAWNASTDNVGVKDYLVYKDSTVIATVTTTSYNVTGLSAGQTYSYYVKARDTANNVSSGSNVLTTTQPQPPDSERPTTPANFRIINVDYRCVEFSFSLSSDNVGVTGYNLYVRLNGSGSFTKETSYQGNSFWSSSTATTGICNSSFAGKSVELYVTAVDAASNESLPTPIASASLPSDTSKPSTPTNLVTTYRSHNSITFKWDPSTDTGSGVSYYIVYRTGGPSGSSPGSTTNSSYTDSSNLNSGDTYRYTVEAVDKAGNRSARSAELTVKTCTLLIGDTSVCAL